MSTAPTAAATATATPAPGKGKKKLIIISAAAVLALAAAGGGTVFLMKKKAADAEAAEGDDSAPAKAAAKHDSHSLPVFVPLEPFTVNLADRDAERYAQIGITLEIDDAKTGDQIKAYMPAIRNHILMAIADRSAAELMDREGKARLAQRVRLETARALGYEVDAVEAPAAAAADDDKAAKADAKRKPKAKKKADATLPIKAVHFSNFIIQ